MSDFVNLQVKEIIKETPNAVSLVFDIPENLREDFNFIPGQFLTLKAMIDGNEIRRAYSISSEQQDADIQVSIKKVPDGTFSVYANEALNAGDYLDVLLPEGKFQLTPKANNAKKYMAFAAGSGITPIMSMIKSVLKNEPDSSFFLVYGNKSPKDTIFYHQLNDFASTQENFEVSYVYSQENVTEALFGRIDKSVVNLMLKNKYQQQTFDAYYLCGPEGMINTVKPVLLENNIEEDKIHVELFTSELTTDPVSEGKATINVVLEDEVIVVEGDKQITLLDNVLNHNVDAPYSCKGGVCCSCICRVVEGEAHMPVNNILTDSELAEGLLLACQSYPVSDDLKIDFDDA